MTDDQSKWYEVLGLEPGAGPAEVKRAYRDLLKLWRAKRSFGDAHQRERARKRLDEIQRAYETLSRGAAPPEAARQAVAERAEVPGRAGARRSRSATVERRIAPPAAERPPRRPTRIGRLCQALYELALLFAALLFVLAPIHQAATQHADVDQVVGPDHVIVSCDGAARLSPGDEFPVYRFNPDWQTAIGKVVVERVLGSRVLMRYDPQSFRWPMGRQARITEARGDFVRVDMGDDVGLHVGDMLNVFRDRLPVGRIVLAQVDARSSWARVIERRVPDLEGALAGEYTFATQVVIYKNPLLSALEILGAVVLLGGYLFTWFWLGGSPLLALGDRLRPALRRLDRPALRVALTVLAGVPFVWFLARLAVELVVYAAGLAAPLFGGGDPQAVAPFDRALHGSLPVLYAAGALLYSFVLLRTGRSPILAFWRRMSFAGGPLKRVPAGAPRHAVTWLLHLVIAYAFASTLIAVAGANLIEALGTAWPGSGIQVSGSVDLASLSSVGGFVSGIGSATAYMLMHRPHFANLDAFYAVARYVVWTLAIAGGLFGYGYSVVSYAWGKRIRNLDFTAAGWLTNAVCYGPLLGLIVWQMVPPMTGVDPVFASGPLVQMNHAVELFLNILYTLSICNLGTMFGVMTDKGVRTTGFYSVVRHPSYILEALMFVSLQMKGLTTGYQWLAVCMYLFIYWVRSEREDDFMTRSNPDFTPYREATHFKFIPGVY